MRHKPASPITSKDVLTPFNTRSLETLIPEYRQWLTDTGASPITIDNYARAINRWFAILASNSTVRPSELWCRWNATPGIKRLAGYAGRRWTEFIASTYGENVDLGIPSRLPPPSAPRPRPISDTHFRLLTRTAKRILPERTGYSVRVWLAFVEELGLRRSESVIEWRQIDWVAQAVTVVGKTGSRELPLSGSMLRRLRWLRRKNPLFPWCGNRGQRLSGGVLYNAVRAVAAAGGESGLRPHLLRHRRLTLLCRRHLATNQLLVLSVSGHSHISSLLPYYQVSLSEKRALMAEA